MLDYDPAERNSHHYVVIEVGRDVCGVSATQIVAALQAENILARKYFWPGCHKMKPYRDLFPHAGQMLTKTRLVAERVIVLPTGMAIDLETIDIVCAVIRQLVSEPA